MSGDDAARRDHQDWGSETYVDEWVAGQSKELAYERARRSQSAYLYFPGRDFEDQAAVFGNDPYPIGLQAMSRTIERAIRGSQEQGLLRRPLRLEDVCYRTTLNT
jgi:hypothetical protein